MCPCLCLLITTIRAMRDLGGGSWRPGRIWCHQGLQVLGRGQEGIWDKTVNSELMRSYMLSSTALCYSRAYVFYSRALSWQFAIVGNI